MSLIPTNCNIQAQKPRHYIRWYNGFIHFCVGTHRGLLCLSRLMSPSPQLPWNKSLHRPCLLLDWYSVLCFQSFQITSHDTRQRFPNNAPLHSQSFIRTWGYLHITSEVRFWALPISVGVKSLTMSVESFCCFFASWRKITNRAAFLPQPKKEPKGKRLKKEVPVKKNVHLKSTVV